MRWWVVHLWVEGFFEIFASVDVIYHSIYQTWFWVEWKAAKIFILGNKQSTAILPAEAVTQLQIVISTGGRNPMYSLSTQVECGISQSITPSIWQLEVVQHSRQAVWFWVKGNEIKSTKGFSQLDFLDLLSRRVLTNSELNLGIENFLCRLPLKML